MTQEQLIDKHYSTLFEVWQGSERKALLLSCLHTIASDLLFARVARRVTSEVDLSHGDLQAYFKRNVTILAEVLQRFAASTNQVLSINLVDWLYLFFGCCFLSFFAWCYSNYASKKSAQ